MELVELQNPSVEFYLQLQKTHNDVSCPCTQISVAYGSFVELSPIYHAICFSDFISQTWIDLLVDNRTAMRYPIDFRSSASLQFQVLRELCSRSRTVLNNNIQSFYNTKLISGYLTRENLLLIDTEAVIDTLKKRIFEDFQQPILFIRPLMIDNLIASGIQTAGLLGYYPQNNIPDAIFVITNYHRGASCEYSCTCDNADTCAVPAVFYNDTLFSIQQQFCYIDGVTRTPFAMKNWFVGCWALGSLLLSSVESSFLNNQTALELIALHSNWSSSLILPTVLNLNVSQQANKSNNTFNDLLQNLFVEELLPVINYSLYFTECRPRSCFYLMTRSSNILYIFTSLLALYGGLSIVLQFLVPYIVT
ncbi:hypothetical protein I4U23_011071 [Adineta vaga]|nr:hypothetical protein I4U23_011071 [Adineta vaga]